MSLLFTVSWALKKESIHIHMADMTVWRTVNLFFFGHVLRRKPQNQRPNKDNFMSYRYPISYRKKKIPLKKKQ